MVRSSRLETNFKLLLGRCECMASEKDGIDWRLEKYVSALQDQLLELRQSNSKPEQETMTEYKRRMDFLKGLIEADKLSDVNEKVLATEFLAPASSSTKNCHVSRELHLTKKAAVYEEVRTELFSKAKEENGAGVRHRVSVTSSKPEVPSTQSSTAEEQNLDTILEHHNQIQEQLAAEMLNLARSLKDNATAANIIVKQDNAKLSETAVLAEGNTGKLKVESARLEAHVAAGCNCWLWIMLLIVTMTFISMVIFMKMFTKKY